MTKRFVIKTGAQFSQAVLGISGLLSDGNAQFVVISGLQGSGKTHLLKQALEAARMPLLFAPSVGLKAIKLAAFAGFLAVDNCSESDCQKLLVLTRGVYPAGMYRRGFGIFVTVNDPSIDFCRTATHHFHLQKP
jgi:hypothetical protein